MKMYICCEDENRKPLSAKPNEKEGYVFHRPYGKASQVQGNIAPLNDSMSHMVTNHMVNTYRDQNVHNPVNKKDALIVEKDKPIMSF